MTLKKTVFLFPGQGSQVVGMGLDLYREFESIRDLFEMANEITHTNLSKLCFEGPMEELTRTIHLQPALTVISLGFLTAIENEGIRPDIAAGHSLGEYSAIRAAGIVSTEDILRLAFKRGELMHREATKHQGTMHAIIGLPIDAVQEMVSEAQKDGIVSVANHNAEEQIVITGAPDAVQKVSSLARSRGARAIPLKVSGAWHSELMKGAEAEFTNFMDSITFRAPEKPVVHNVTADFSFDPEEIKSIMVRQLVSPVLWYDSMRKLQGEQAETFAEIGPGKVLTGLLKKIFPRDYPCKIYNVGDMKTLEQFLKELF